jgi:hypothetical protein
VAAGRGGRDSSTGAYLVAAGWAAPAGAAQLHLLDRALPLMGPGFRVVFVTSHQAHVHHRKPVPTAYSPVASSKRAGEDHYAHGQLSWPNEASHWSWPLET